MFLSIILAGTHGLDPRKDRNLRIFLVSIAVACTTPAIARTLEVFRHPEFSALLTSVFDEPQRLSMPIKLILGYVHLHLNAFHYMNFAFNLMALVYYYHGFVHMMSSLKLADQSQHLRSPRCVTKSKKVARLHRELYVMQAVSNDIFGSCMFVMEILGVLSSTLNLFQAVMYSSLKGLTVGLLTILVTFIVFRLVADVYEESQLARRSWVTTTTGDVWFVKFIRSARPLAVNVGSFYFADRQLLFTILDVITTNTANLVLTYRV